MSIFIWKMNTFDTFTYTWPFVTVHSESARGTSFWFILHYQISRSWFNVFSFSAAALINFALASFELHSQRSRYNLASALFAYWRKTQVQRMTNCKFSIPSVPHAYIFLYAVSVCLASACHPIIFINNI